MLNLHTDNANIIDNTEANIHAYNDFDHQIKVLKAKQDKVKKSLLAGYFANNQEFVGSEGLILATYKTQTRNQFVASAFKEEHPDMYKDYTVATEIKVFLTKK